ncbi:hypothetical protein MRX96_058314 [Rhipicephalus microplus]
MDSAMGCKWRVSTRAVLYRVRQRHPVECDSNPPPQSSSAVVFALESWGSAIGPAALADEEITDAVACSGSAAAAVGRRSFDARTVSFVARGLMTTAGSSGARRQRARLHNAASVSEPH